MITVTYPDIASTDDTVTITFTNELGHSMTRTHPVPRTDSGTVDEVFLQSVIQSTLNKINIGIAKFTNTEAPPPSYYENL